MSVIEIHLTGYVTGRRILFHIPSCLWAAGCRLVEPQAGGAAHLFLLRPSPASHHLIKGNIDSDSTLTPPQLSLLPSREVTQAYSSKELL